MNEAILPFIGYSILQLPVVIVGLNTVTEKTIGFVGLLRSWIYGQIMLFALLEILAVPMILMRWKFDVLFWSFVSISIVLFGFGLRNIRKVQLHNPHLSVFSGILLSMALLLILYQCAIYFFGIHLDEDDATWLAEANDALAFGDMLTRSPASGRPIFSFVEPKIVVSPWPMFYAILSRLLLGTRVSIIAHSAFAPVSLFLQYAIYFLIGNELFSKRESRVVFLLFTGILNLCYAGTVYTQSVFSLVRIWQGKAGVAGIIIPLIIYLFVSIGKYDRTIDWTMLIVTNCASCLMSGMGVSLSAIMIAVLGLYTILAHQKLKRIINYFFSIAPSAVALSVFYFLKG